jgi:prevent-host-death family protein
MKRNSKAIHPQAEVGVRELRQEASKILLRVEEGEEIIVTNHGVPVAKLIPITQTSEDRIRELVEAGELIPAKGKLWETAAPTYVVEGVSASESLIQERRSYL